MTNHTDAHKAEARSRMLEWARCSRIVRNGGRITLDPWRTPLRTVLTIIEYDSAGEVTSINSLNELWLA